MSLTWNVKSRGWIYKDWLSPLQELEPRSSQSLFHLSPMWSMVKIWFQMFPQSLLDTITVLERCGLTQLTPTPFSTVLEWVASNHVLHSLFEGTLSSVRQDLAVRRDLYSVQCNFSCVLCNPLLTLLPFLHRPRMSTALTVSLLLITIFSIIWESTLEL